MKTRQRPAAYFSNPDVQAIFRLSALTIGVLGLISTAQANDIALAAASDVVISGQRVSMRKAIEAQEKANNIISVISSDDIGSLPDKNAAEALARLPGVSVQRDQGEGRYVVVRGLGADLNAVTINGALVPSPEASRRAVALDVLPSGLIRSLEVTKTLRPDQDANSLGGSVEVKSLTAFDMPGKTLTVNTGASYDQVTGKTSPNAGALWADRFLDGKLGIAAGISAEKRSFGSDNVETGGAWDNNRLGGIEFRDYLPERERHAYALNLDYRASREQQYYLRSFLSDFSDDEVRDRLTVSNFSGSSISEGNTSTARAERRLRQRKYTQQISSFVAGTEQHISGWKMEAAAASSRATDDTPESINDARFRGTANFAGVGFTDSQLPKLITPASLSDPASYGLNAITLQQRYSKDTEQHAQLDMSRKLTFDQLESTLKFGAKVSRREKTNDTDQWTYNSSKTTSGNYWGTGSTSLSSFVQGTLDYPFTNIGAAISPALIRARIAGLNRANAKLALESAINDFTLNEDIDAAYLQNTFDFGQWNILAGARVERTKFNAAGSQVSGSAIQSVTRERSYTNWLPSLHTRYDLDKHTSVRAAWTSAVVRANFSQLAPGINLASNTEATIGNPDLAALKASNLDLGIERQLAHDGVVSAYLFHKDIKNFTYTTNLAGTGQWKNYTTATSYANGDTASIQGIELAYSQPLRMLPAPWKYVLIGANASFTNSDANITRFDVASGKTLARSIRFPGQSKRVMNLMLGYEHGAVSTRLALNYKSPYLLELGSDILRADQDRIVETQKQLDFSLSYQLNKRFQLVFEATNLNNEKYYVYQGSPQYNAQYEQYGRTYKVSLKASVF
ncbi:TonB-dependent receptor [Undibacterium sp. FT79W]|uniref:TonB-dependent receptor n=1 Tax=Undibacterium sp. FT79W TaxID=2762296 RepID=UPI00164C23E0|nr:TonB-dependent receptor [Undibacterium sp. FT79W]MBC3876613.1 TonB-dependent receptor [Undibacterium sp. FT79W]